MNYFLDTNCVIFLLKSAYPNLNDRFLSTSAADIKIPVIVKAELLVGAEKSNAREKAFSRIEQFLAPFEIVPFGDETASFYATIRLGLEKAGTPIGNNDLMIASIVLKSRGTLVSHNTREFSRIPNLKLEDWTI